MWHDWHNLVELMEIGIALKKRRLASGKGIVRESPMATTLDRQLLCIGEIALQAHFGWGELIENSP